MTSPLTNQIVPFRRALSPAHIFRVGYIFLLVIAVGVIAGYLVASLTTMALIELATMSASKKNFPDALVQEIRALLAVHCKETVMKDKADGDKKASLADTMQKVYHGSAGYASVLDLFINAKEPYASFFNIIDIENNREGNETRVHGVMYELNELFHCDTSTRYVIGERAFTKEVLATAGNTATLVKGRILAEKALVVAANYKKALSIYEDYCVAPGKLPSGKQLEDMLLHVREQMFVFLQGSSDEKPRKPKTKLVVADMKDTWFFRGYMAFALFGPMPVSGRNLSVFSVDGKNIPKGSRKDQRQKEKEMKAAERDLAVNGYAPKEYRRGVSLKEKAQCAMFAQSQVSETKRDLRDLLVICESQHSNLLKEMEQLNKTLETVGNMPDFDGKYDEIGRMLKDRHELCLQVKVLKDRKVQLQKESDEARKTLSKKRQIEAYYEQVGDFDNPVVIDGTATDVSPLTEHMETKDTDGDDFQHTSQVITFTADKTKKKTLVGKQAKKTTEKEPSATKKRKAGHITLSDFSSSSSSDNESDDEQQ